MKKFIKITVLLLIINSTFIIHNSFAQWIQQTTNTTQTLRDIEFINRYTGWVCGDGVIFKTTNGGLNWNEQTHPASNRLLSNIHPVNSNLVFCVGESKTILKTTNGGINWFSIWHDTTGQHLGYNAVFFINENTGWISGRNHVLKTTNGGNIFDSLGMSSGEILDFYFKDLNNGVGVGWFAKTFKTTNGGINWQMEQIAYLWMGYLFRVTFINDFTGWTAFGKSVYKTTNFGSDWDSISNTGEYLLAYCIEFTNTSTGWTAGRDEPQNGALFKSTDGGFHWRRENLTTEPIYDIYSYNDTIVWVIGEQGKIWFTTTGGQVFVNQISTEIPDDFTLHQNYPNPFNNQTTIEFDIKKKGDYSFVIYDCLGRKRDEVFNEYLNVGSYSVSFNGDELQSGVYFYRLSADGNVISTKKMLLIK